MTQGHCAYCDSLMDPGLAESIDHFRPKACARFPHLAFEWTNLFLACGTCQRQKGDHFEEPLLKPDADDYDFDAWFAIRARDGIIEPRADLTPARREQAETTIRLLGLNKNGLPSARTREWKKREAASDAVTADDWSFRFA